MTLVNATIKKYKRSTFLAFDTAIIALVSDIPDKHIHYECYDQQRRKKRETRALADKIFREVAFVLVSAHISVVFNLPTIASGQGANAQAFSDWYQFGNGTTSEICKGHGLLSAAFESKAPYNNHAGIYYLTLEAHDVSGEYDIYY